MREIVFTLGPVPRRTAAGLLGAKDGVSCSDANLNDGATSAAENGRPETY